MKAKFLLLSFVMLLSIVSCKKDTEVNKDTFKIKNERIEAGTQSVTIAGSYEYAGTIDAITLELGRQTDLMDSDAHRALLDGTDFSVEVKSLRTNTAYYYRYVVDYGAKEPYRTEIKTFSTLEYNLPEVASGEVLSVGVNRAEVSGEVLGDGGGDAVTLRGICWGTHHNPSIGDEYANSGEGVGEFTCELTNLQPEKTYYARAFAGNSKGVSYGTELTFVTLTAGSLAEVRTLGVVGNAMLQATVEGEVTSEGTSPVLERGVCYGKEHYPTTSGFHVSSGMGVGEYSCQLSNLEANVKYYVRAYAINSLGISYGEELSFVAMTETTTPVVETGMVSDMTVSTATGRGKVLSDGGATVTRRGLCWSTEQEPTVDGTHADCGSGVGDFSGLMPHLTDMTTYYVRAYAENSVGMAYGEVVSFTVGQHVFTVPPTVVTDDVTGITQTTAVGHGNVTTDGGAEVTERGICWSTSPNPTTDDSHANNGTGSGAYAAMITGLQPNTTYHVRAYAINEVGTAYGDDVSFTTSQTPTYTVSVSANPTEGGTVSGAGEYEEGASCTLTATANPGYTFTNWTENGNVVSTNASYTFNVVDSRNLVANFSLNTYAVAVSANPANGGTVTGGNTYNYGQSCTVNATAATGYTFTNWTENGSVVSTDANYTFTVNANRNLVANFTLNTYTVAVSANPTNGGTVTGGNTYNYGESCSVSATAATGYTFTNWTENGTVVSTNANYTFTVNANRNLVANFEVLMSGDEFIVDFEGGMPAGWTTIDADGDGYGWVLGSVEFQGQANGHGGSSDLICSSSYNNFEALSPDNYLVSPQVNISVGSMFSFYACAQDNLYPNDHFGVAISTTGTSPNDFITIQEWTMTAKSSSVSTNYTRSGNRAQGNWYQYTVDLSAYSGRQIYIAIRHFNCVDQYYIDVDDIELSNAKK